MARSYGVEGITVTHSDQFADALRHALELGKPCLLDVHVDADVRPTATGTWQLPPTAYGEPTFGKRYVPGQTDDETENPPMPEARRLGLMGSPSRDRLKWPPLSPIRRASIE